MNLKGKLSIYKVVNGRVEPIFKDNAITYAGRNIMVDLLGSGTSNLNYMCPMLIPESSSGDRGFIPLSDHLIDFIGIAPTNYASIDITSATQTVNGHTITATQTIGYSPADNTGLGSQAKLTYEVNIPFDVFVTDSEFNCIGIFDGTEDPAVDISASRLFSFAVLPSTITVGEFDNIVITYTYEIQ